MTAMMSKVELSPLPYDYKALEPYISEQTLRYHHDKHLAAYVNKTLELAAGTSFAMQLRCGTITSILLNYRQTQIQNPRGSCARLLTRVLEVTRSYVSE